ncbi:hypothetical protein [Mariniluteicoccus flavus]
MSERETFSVSELTNHARSMGEVASQVGATVAQASKQPNPLMYGALMSPLLTGVMTAITSAGGRYLQEASNAVNATRDGLEKTRDAYAKVEQTNTELASRAND